ncbi:uncharacterized protein L201_000958 [Kwoniella dendrophila CBS 6074]|uniref:HIT-type domain-containing protein n=1 Tax=Kwoniella dendrophila CBS 6074 TaxID=1295534 RepID=A0AAX4JL11_9TREE
MNHPLPARPSFLPSSSSSTAGPSKPSSIPLNSTATHTTINAKSTATPIDTTKCVVCYTPPKYTCPRCSKRTCSLECSKKHKSMDECNGIRDPTSFVPLNQYGQGVWSDDYKWLEEGRRKVIGWGENVKIEEIKSTSSNNIIRRNNNNDRNQKIKRNHHHHHQKSDLLKRELQKRNCQIDFMPNGMEKRNINQSSWNPKTKQLNITIHIIIPFKLFDPNSTNDSYKTINHPRILFASNDSKPLPTLKSLITIPIEMTDIVFILAFHSTPSRPSPEHEKGQKLYYPPLDPSNTLAEVLSGTAWVEYPIIEIMEKSKWEEGLKKGNYMVVPLSEPLIQIRTRDSGWGKRKIDSVDNELEENTVSVVNDSKQDGPKKAKIITECLMALGDYGSDGAEDDVDEEDHVDEADSGDDVEEDLLGVQAEEIVKGLSEEPSLEVLQAVGMALAADLGEA